MTDERKAGIQKELSMTRLGFALIISIFFLLGKVVPLDLAVQSRMSEAEHQGSFSLIAARQPQSATDQVQFITAYFFLKVYALRRLIKFALFESFYFRDQRSSDSSDRFHLADQTAFGIKTILILA